MDPIIISIRVRVRVRVMVRVGVNYGGPVLIRFSK